MHTIDAKAFQKLFLAGANRINEQKEYINELNVFPVPDGDTGTNMSLTILSAAKEVEKISNPTIASLCKAISGGSLRGARGNSGVYHHAHQAAVIRRRKGTERIFPWHG